MRRFVIHALAALLSLLCAPALADESTPERLRQSIAGAVVSDPASLQRLLTRRNVERLSQDEKAELLLELIERKRLAGLTAAVGAGIDVNAPLIIDREGEPVSLTPLNYALGAHVESDVAIRLIDLGANINLASIDDNPPLLTAIGLRAYPAIERLLEAGADPNVADRLIGLTPLMLAVGAPEDHARMLKVAQRLVRRGADIQARTTTGHDALAFARRAGNEMAVAWLLSAGSDSSPEKSPVAPEPDG